MLRELGSSVLFTAAGRAGLAFFDGRKAWLEKQIIIQVAQRLPKKISCITCLIATDLMRSLGLIPAKER
jgi:hypothetical protein